MLSSTLKPAVKRKRKTGNHIPKHNVGEGREPMTTRQIAAELGCDAGVVRNRINKGWKGEQLLLPIHTRRKSGMPRTYTQVVALKLALAFGKKVPSAAQIQAVHPMAYSAAQHWRNAIKYAIEALK